MMGTQKVEVQLFFYEFDLDAHVPPKHVLSEIDRFLDMGDMREKLMPFHSHTDRPSIDPELIVRMLVIGCVMGKPPKNLQPGGPTKGSSSAPFSQT